MESQHNEDKSLNRRESYSAAIHYEDCTGAAFRIRKGISKTPLQVLKCIVMDLLHTIVYKFMCSCLLEPCDKRKKESGCI